MLALVLSMILAAVLAVFAFIRAKTRTLLQHSEKIPGPKTLPILGNALEFGLKAEDYLKQIDRLVTEHGSVVRIWMGPMLFIAVMDPKVIEVFMNSTKHIDKAFSYTFLHPWLGTGLLTSTGQKWKAHRKFLTPAFHFKILEQFIEVFNANGNIMIEQLSKHVDGPEFDVCSYVTLCTLDIISETAMGVKVNAQRDSSSEYVQAIRGLGDLVMQRMFKPWIQPDFLFRLSSYDNLQTKYLATLHGMTNSVIQSRKKEFAAQKTASNGHSNDHDDDIGTKRRLAFLDLLLQSSADEGGLTDKDIQEEVDTFMFEGHDTTSSGIFFTLWCLAKYQDVQEKAFAEQYNMFGDSDRDPSYADLQEMKYMELVIKETLRLYPSVPIYGRELNEDIAVGNYLLPAGCNIIFLPYFLHRNPEYFPNPLKFDPERFQQDNSIGRHPYCYVPFAAGARNCIGQKFAMLELKAAVSKVIRRYKLTLDNPREELDVKIELILKSINGVKLKIENRKIVTRL